MHALPPFEQHTTASKCCSSWCAPAALEIMLTRCPVHQLAAAAKGRPLWNKAPQLRAASGSLLHQVELLQWGILEGSRR